MDFKVIVESRPKNASTAKSGPRTKLDVQSSKPKQQPKGKKTPTKRKPPQNAVPAGSKKSKSGGGSATAVNVPQFPSFPPQFMAGPPAPSSVPLLNGSLDVISRLMLNQKSRARENSLESTLLQTLLTSYQTSLEQQKKQQEEIAQLRNDIQKLRSETVTELKGRIDRMETLLKEQQQQKDSARFEGAGPNVVVKKEKIECPYCNESYSKGYIYTHKKQCSANRNDEGNDGSGGDRSDDSNSYW